MSQTTISVHPQIKNIIKNLDLDLDLELNRYEQSRLHDFVLIAQSSTDDNSFHPNNSSPYLVYQPSIFQQEKQEEAIPVASRLIDEKTSVLDRILTPWGIFGIIIFFGANLFILMNLDTRTQSVSELNNNQPQINNSGNQNQSNTINSEEVNPVVNTNQQLPLPPQLPNVNNLSVVSQTSKTTSPYPDLQTALFSEIQKQQLPVTKPPVKDNENKSVSTTINTNVKPANQSNDQSHQDTSKKKEAQYYVICKYQNMDSFTRIKKIVPSALITNINQEMKIQLAVFNSENEAMKKSQQLKNKGVDNYLYQKTF